NRGLVVAGWPWSGYYKVTPLTWVTAQTTQFAKPGWRYVKGGSRLLPAGGSVVTYEHRHDWSAVAQTTTTTPPQRLTFKISRPITSGTIHVWGSDLRHHRYLVRLATWHGRTVTLTLQPGWIYSLTTTTGQRLHAARPAGKPTSAPLPYTTTRDS